MEGLADDLENDVNKKSACPLFQRWLLEDFQNEAEWREIPQKIVLAPGIEIIIPRPKLIVPDGLDA